ncbi:ARM repeat-containing protein [Haematococcus lacustris]
MAAVVEVTAILLQAQSADTAQRSAAEEQLRAFQDQNFPGFLASLATELANHGKPADSRRLAGLMLKNALDAKDDARKRELYARWQATDPALRQHVRDALLATLASEAADVRHTAAMAVAKVAAVDLPRQEWPTLISTLLSNMNAQPVSTGTRQATLEAMGYVCEEMAQVKNDVLTPSEINMILTAVVAGMGDTEPNESRLAATVALGNAIEFAHHNFENEGERNYLMQVVCQGTQASELRIRVASFECLHEIAALYYSKLVPYMTQIYALTVKAINDDTEEVALQAIEFWNTICEEEYDLTADADPDAPCHNFIKAASPHLVPILLQQLTKQEEGQEQDETAWNLSTASGTCLGLAARVVQDAIVPMVMPFIQANISKNTTAEDWRLREAATFAFGLILDGPEPAMFQDTAKQALGFLLQAMKDPHPQVKDVTAWTIGRIFEFLHDSSQPNPIVTNDVLPAIMTVLLESLKDASHVAYRVCCAISQLAMGFTHHQGGTSPMSPFFKESISALLHCAQRHASHEHSRVQISAFEAINDLVRAASRDTLDVVAQLIQVILAEIHKTFDLPATTSEACEKQAEVQTQLCGVLQVIVQKLADEEDTKPAVLPYADSIMETLLRIFNFRSSTVHEEAMLAVGAFSNAMGKAFIKYLPTFFTYLKIGLTNYKEWQVCLSTVGVLGDVCRNVEEAILPYCDEIMSILITNLGREDVHRNIKPQILAAFGDIAIFIGDKFEKYLDAVLRVLQQAMQLSIASAQSGEADFVEYNNMLRNGIMDAYSGIIQGLGPAKCQQYLTNEIAPVLDFVSSIGAEAGPNSEPDADVAKSAVMLLGDICACMTVAGSIFKHTAKRDWESVVNYCRATTGLQAETEWAVNMIDDRTQRAT